jgi:hypothetical protein
VDSERQRTIVPIQQDLGLAGTKDDTPLQVHGEFGPMDDGAVEVLSEEQGRCPVLLVGAGRPTGLSSRGVRRYVGRVPTLSPERSGCRLASAPAARGWRAPRGPPIEGVLHWGVSHHLEMPG